MRLAVLLLPAALSLGVAANAQSGLLSQLGGAKTSGSGALGGLMPNIGGAGANNITGLLGYCLKNQLLGGVSPTTNAGSAGTLLGKLSGKSGVTQSQGFLAGQQGVLQTGGSNLPIGSLGDGVKQQLCKGVLSRAQGMLGR